jgi:phage-related protein
VKLLRFLGNSLECFRQFPEEARHDVGYQLEQVQHGKQPTDFKSMSSVGKGVKELRVWDDSGTYRVVYIARFAEAVYVLHAFQKKARATSERDIELVRTRYAELRRGRHD